MQCERLDTELAVSHPGRGGSLREGNAGVAALREL